MNIEIDKLNSDRVISMIYNNLLESRNNNSRSGDYPQATKTEVAEAEMNVVMEGLKKIADASDILNKKVRLSFNEDINRVIITIMNKETNEVLQEIPCKELQDLALHLKEAIGILFDKTA